MKTLGQLLGALALLCLSCSSKRTPEEDLGGETHWLAACAVDVDCDDAELSCVCGSCTHACSADSQCTGGVAAACFDSDSPLLLQRCEDRIPDGADAVCLPSCTKDAECGRGRACMQNACVPADRAQNASAQPRGDGGTTSVGTDQRPDASIADLGTLAVSDVSWSEPVMVPEPSVPIAGADERILGTWHEVDCDPAQPREQPPWGCLRLTIERDATGAVVGHLLVARPESNPLVYPKPLNGPFAPADADHGYPIEVDILDYSRLANTLAGNVPYRLLDARFESDALTFGWSGHDLWHDWCALQRPQRWDVDGHGFWFCVPQDRHAQMSIDEAKNVLCTTADLEPLCSQGAELLPCPCIEDANPRCSHAFCRCNADGCDANAHYARRGRLALAADRLTGTWNFEIPEVAVAVTLERVTP